MALLSNAESFTGECTTWMESNGVSFFHVYLVGFYFLALGVHIDTRWVWDGYPKHFNGSEGFENEEQCLAHLPILLELYA